MIFARNDVLYSKYYRKKNTWNFLLYMVQYCTVMHTEDSV